MRVLHYPRLSFVFLFVACLGMAQVAKEKGSASRYSLIDLGLIPGAKASRAQALNDRGQAVGTCTLNSGINESFVFSDGRMDAIPSLRGVPSWPSAINNQGDVVGLYYTRTFTESHAFIVRKGTLTDLGTLGGVSSRAQDVNNSGEVVGESTRTDKIGHAFVYRNGKMKALGAIRRPDDFSFAHGINNLGEIVGFSDVSTTMYPLDHAFIFRSGRIVDLGSPSTSFSRAVKINDKGHIVGDFGLKNPERTHAFLYRDRRFTDLGTLGGQYSWARDINSKDEVVGESHLTDDFKTSKRHGFLWMSGRMFDLNDLIAPGSGWELLDATGINERGQIVGCGRLAGVERAYMLTPVSGHKDSGPKWTGHIFELKQIATDRVIRFLLVVSSNRGKGSGMVSVMGSG